MTRFRRGDIALVLFPNSDLRTAKKRPVLIVQRDNLGTGLKQYVVAMVSSNMERADHPSRVSVLAASVEGRKTGLLTDSVIMTDNLATILDDEFERIIGRYDNMRQVDTALCYTLEVK